MGYYYNITETDFVIPAEQANAARDAFLAGVPERVRPSAELLADKPLTAVLGAFYFGTHVLDNGDIAITSGESKYHFQMRLLGGIAPFLTEGAFAIWRGEEGDLYRQLVVDHTMVEQQGQVTFR